jgi:hypothetical protein
MGPNPVTLVIRLACRCAPNPSIDQLVELLICRSKSSKSRSSRATAPCCPPRWPMRRSARLPLRRPKLRSSVRSWRWHPARAGSRAQHLVPVSVGRLALVPGKQDQRCPRRVVQRPFHGWKEGGEQCLQAVDAAKPRQP